MNQARVAPAATRRASRWRSPWVLLGVPALIFVLLTINVLASGPLVGTDQRIRAFVQSHWGSAGWHWLDAPARLVVNLAGPGVAVPVLAVAALAVSARRRSLRPLLTAAAAAALLLVTVIPAKILIGRLSPGQRPLAPGALGSFPSGHMTTAAVCYVVAVLLVAALLPARVRRGAVAIALAWCLVVGAALVWRNEHWSTDVVAGWALAAIVIQVALRLTRGAARGTAAGPPGTAGQRDYQAVSRGPG
jgi:membrane-associated phospholipid phosphatase